MQDQPTALRKLHEAPIVKAARLVREDRVMRRADTAVYDVQGDHYLYRVVAGPEGIQCPCAARTPLCSHALAVAAVRERDRPPGEFSLRIGVTR